MFVFVASAAFFHLARASAGFWGIDDAAITYSAAYEVADHRSFAAFVEGPPIESYSNPAVFWVVVLLRWFGIFDPITTHLRLELVIFATMSAGVAMILLRFVGRLAAFLGTAMFVAVQLLTPATWLWYGSGLENVWVSGGLVWLIWMAARSLAGKRVVIWYGLVAFVVALMRPEAPVYVAAFYLTLLVGVPPGESRRKHILAVMMTGLVTAALYIGYLIFRHQVYDDILPNTYYAKLPDARGPLSNLREYVAGSLLPYSLSAVGIASLVGLIRFEKINRLVPLLLIFLGASLTLPITAGEDWMGEHRFGTAYLLVAHLCFAFFFAAHVHSTRTDKPRYGFLGICMALLVPAILAASTNFSPRGAYDMSIARVGELQGGLRWEQQMRAGVPYAVSLMPDAGGSLLVGAMQIVDDGYLADFQIPRLGRKMDLAVDRVVLNQYEHEERRPDLVDGSPNFAFDTSYIGTRYLSGEDRLSVRRDLAVVEQVPPAAKILWRSEHVTIYLSPSSVLVAGPEGLVRCEVLVSWNDLASVNSTELRLQLFGIDEDTIRLHPYRQVQAGIERRALLLQAPSFGGTFDVHFRVDQKQKLVAASKAFSITVLSEVEQIRSYAVELTKFDVDTAIFRLAWFREQLIPRLSMVRFRTALEQLDLAHRKRHRSAGQLLELLRWNARLADLETGTHKLLRPFENKIIESAIDACSPKVDDARALCLGRTVDQLRRLGYLGVVERSSRLRQELTTARASIGGLAEPQRYRVLLGLVLADPSNIPLQRSLIRSRLLVAQRGTLPQVRD